MKLSTPSHSGISSSFRILDQPSKAAVNHLTSSLAIKLIGRHITYVSSSRVSYNPLFLTTLKRTSYSVNAILPGLFPSKMTAFGFNTAGDEVLLQGQPSGRYGQPSDIAGLALFLSSPASAHITGTHTLLDGGSRYLAHAAAPAVKL